MRLCGIGKIIVLLPRVCKYLCMRERILNSTDTKQAANAKSNGHS